MRLPILLALLALGNMAYGSVNCRGTIKEIYKWDNFETFSVKIEISGQGVTNWLSMPSKSDESMALMAYASQKPVHVYMSEDGVTNCIDGWSHNKKLKGYFVIQ